MTIIRILWILLIIIIGTGNGLAAAQDDGSMAESDSSWTVVSTTETELLTGPMRTLVSLAPDGKRFVHMEGQTMCIYTISMVQEYCFEFDRDTRMATETLRWSPDSRYLTFSEDFFRMFINSSIWLVDVMTEEVRALTEVQYGRVDIGADDWPDIDVLPTWSPDGDLYFLRLTQRDGEQMSPALYRFDDLNSDPTEMGALHDFGMVATYAMAISDHLIVFNAGPPTNHDDMGLWTRAIEESEPHQVLHTEPNNIPYTLAISPDSRMILFVTGEIYTVDPLNPESSPARVVDLSTGELLLLNQEHRAMHGGWNPVGSAFAYVVYSTPEAPENGLYITERAGTPGDMVLAGDFYLPIVPGLPQLPWAANNTLMLGKREELTALIVQLEQE